MTGHLLRGTSLIPYIFVILLLFIVLVSWDYFESGFGDTESQKITDTKTLNLLKSEIESAKRFSKQSLIYSSDRALSEHALEGGICSNYEVNSWVCNSPDTPSFGEVVNCLEQNTLKYTNEYLANYSVNSAFTYDLAAFTEINYNLSESAMLDGTYDEGNYTITLGGSSIEVSTDEGKISESIEFVESSSKNRFWYLYRNFHEWSNENNFSKEALECTTLCLGCECIEHSAEDALESLQGRFDEYVTCNFDRACCTRGPSRLTGLLNGVEFWDQSDCISGCGLSCAEDEQEYGEIDTTPFLNIPSTETHEGVSDNKLAAVYEFSCTDEKYYVSGGGGPDALVFTVRVSVSYDDLGGC